MRRCAIVLAVALIIILLGSNVLLMAMAYQSHEDVMRAARRLYAYQHVPEYAPLDTDEVTIIGKFVVPNYRLGMEDNDDPTSLFFINNKHQMSYDEIYDMAKEVVNYIPEIRATPDVIKLMVETVITESDGGMYYDTDNLGGLGIAQVNYKTAKYLRDYMKTNKKHIHDAVEDYKEDKYSLRENMIHNMGYNLALCIAYYYHQLGDKLYSSINTLAKRAAVWKKVYNTEAGAGTAEIYIKRVRNYAGGRGKEGRK